MRSKAHRSNGEPPLQNRGEVIMPTLKGKKPRKKQRRSFLPWIDKIAVALYWVLTYSLRLKSRALRLILVKTILLLIEWFAR